MWGNIRLSAAGYNQTNIAVGTAAMTDSNNVLLDVLDTYVFVDNHGHRFVWILWALIGLRIAVSCVAIIV